MNRHLAHLLLAIIFAFTVVNAFKLPDTGLGDILYRRMLSNAPEDGSVYYCVTLSNEQNPSWSAVAGCWPPNYIATTRVLSTRSWNSAIAAKVESTTTTLTPDDVANVVASLMMAGGGRYKTEPVGLVVVPPESDGAKRLFELSCSFLLDVILVLQSPKHGLKISVLVFPYYSLPDGGQSGSTATTTTTMCSFSALADRSPLASQSPYPSSTRRAWLSPDTASKPTNGLLWKPLNLTILQVDLTTKNRRNDDAVAFWNDLVKKAEFNSRDTSITTTDFATQTNAAMSYVKYPPSTAPLRESTNPEYDKKRLDCIARGTCLPIGGFSVWASTRPTEDPRKNVDERRQQAAASAAAAANSTTADGGNSKHRFRRTVGILIPSTTTAFFHDNVPGANGAASGITAGLAIADAITNNVALQNLLGLQIPLHANFSQQQQGGNNESVDPSSSWWEPTHVHLLFAAADEYGLAGSGRFVKELITLNCTSSATSFNQSVMAGGVSCFSPVYRRLNFTATDLEEYTHIFALEQLLVGDRLFFHTDKTARANIPPPAGVLYKDASFNFGASSAQQRAQQFFAQQTGVSLSSQDQLPPNGLYSFFDAVSAKNARLHAAAAAAAASSSSSGQHADYIRRWNGQSNETVLATLSAFDAQYTDKYFQSAGDTADRKNMHGSNSNNNNNSVNTALITRAAEVVVDFLIDLWKTELMDFAASGAALDNSLIPAPGSLPSSSAAIINSTLTRTFWDCLGVRDTAACTSLLTAPATTFYPGVFAGYTVRAAIHQRVVRAYVDHFFSRINNTDNREKQGACPCSDPRSVVSMTCSSVSSRCIVQRAFFVHAFSPAADYSTSGHGFLNTTPSDEYVRWLPRVLIGSDAAPIWTESNWRSLEARTAQRQLYDGSPLLGVSIVVTVLTAILTGVIFKYVLS